MVDLLQAGILFTGVEILSAPMPQKLEQQPYRPLELKLNFTFLLICSPQCNLYSRGSGRVRMFSELNANIGGSRAGLDPPLRTLVGDDLGFLHVLRWLTL